MKLTHRIAKQLRRQGLTFGQIAKRFGVSEITANRRARGAVRTTVNLPRRRCGSCKRKFHPKDSDQKYCKRGCLFNALRKPHTIYPKPSKEGYRVGHKWVDGKRVAIKEHREVLGLSDPNILGHHRDRNRSNNRRSNLSPMTRREHLDEHSRKWLKKEIELLGKVSDEFVGAKLGISSSAVRKKRIALAIPAFRDIEWNPDHDALLGTDFDIIIAKRVGVSRAEIWRRRNKLGVAAKGNPKRSTR